MQILTGWEQLYRCGIHMPFCYTPLTIDQSYNCIKRQENMKPHPLS